MALSYSFHISNGKNAINNLSKITKVDKHNNRKYNSNSYDKNINETLIGSNNIFEDIKKTYEEEFEESRITYNQKQKRNDRKIDNYLEHVANSKKDIAVEIIIQVGDMDFWKDKNLNDRKQMRAIFEKQIDKLNLNLPQFKISNATVHFDENSPHMHIIGIPVAENFKNGLNKQVSKRKIFTKETLEFLQNKMREDVEIDMQKIYGKDINLKSKEKGRNKDLFKNEFIEIKQEISKEKEILKEKKEEIKELVDKYTNSSTVINLKDLERINNNKQIKNKSFFSNEKNIILNEEDYNKLFIMSSNNSKIIEKYKNKISNLENNIEENKKEIKSLKENNSKLNDKEKNSNKYFLLKSILKNLLPKNTFSILEEKIFKNENINIWKKEKIEKEIYEKLDIKIEEKNKDFFR